MAEVFMRNIAHSATVNEITIELAKVLHGPDYFEWNKVAPLNFHVSLHPPKRNRNFGGGRPNSRTGSLTLPEEELGKQFLRQFGVSKPSIRIIVRDREIYFSLSNRPPRDATVQDIRRLPFVDPVSLQKQADVLQDLQAHSIGLISFQFGVIGRDGLFSVEWDSAGKFDLCWLKFDGERRAILLKMQVTSPLEEAQVAAMSFSQVEAAATSRASGQPVITLTLFQPPTFESEVSEKYADSILMEEDPHLYFYIRDNNPRQRLSSLKDSEHSRVAPWASFALRITCASDRDLISFHRLCRVANLQKPHDYDYPVIPRGRFSARTMRKVQDWLSDLANSALWSVGYQVEALIRSGSMHAEELLEIRDDIEELVAKEGGQYAASFLRHFQFQAFRFGWTSETLGDKNQSIRGCFRQSTRDYTPFIAQGVPSRTTSDFDCLHVTITPTLMYLEGPFPEKSNRVIRYYENHQDSFVRVAFTEENRLSFRFDRQVDGPGFIRRRVGSTLHEGLMIAGKKFDFLAYSQSALKEHAVWFVTPFIDDRYGRVDAATIIARLGSFENLSFDRRLIYCPARYGARISQAFTTTDASVTVESEEILRIPDITYNGSCFTDGVGTISPELAKDIWLKLTDRRARRNRVSPRAYQIRLMGSKGMLSVNYKMQGKLLCLRPSMIKFDAPDSLHVEIARVFDKPGPMFLNRPLIMLLEGLGVPAEVFLDLQAAAVRDVQESTRSLSTASRLLESHGLGTSFRLSSVFLNLQKLGLDLDDAFYHRMLEFAVNHVMRELKHHARIPVPHAWSLVGVADEHSYLKEGQIYACVKQPHSARHYLRGQVLISRSPTIHPGDVQLVRAIGKPPAGSPFDREPLQNTVVFSTQGARSLPSCLGGGDLDGDTYNLVELSEFPALKPLKTYTPAAYDAASRKELDRPSTMADVADFVVEYIISDVLGIIAINWLIIADQSDLGIMDPACLTLAKLHSDAVDFPKSGRPVPVTEVPKLKHKAKPDWNAPETITGGNYYLSQRAIGKLYREIELQDLPQQSLESQESHLPDDFDVADLEQAMRALSFDDSIHDTLKQTVSEFIDLESGERTTTSVVSLFRRYASELQFICSTHAIIHRRSATLTEEEAVIGTIAAKCSQHRKRKERMSSLREQTAQLVAEVRDDLLGDDEANDRESLRRAWVAWELSIVQTKENTFGAKSFWYICIGAVFEAIKAIEDEERADRAEFADW